MGSIEHRDGTTWRAVARVGQTGKRRKISRNFQANGKREAERLGIGVLAAMTADHEQGELTPGSMAELVADWLKVKKYSVRDSTMADYERWAPIISARFGSTRAVDITGATINAWYSELLESGKSTAYPKKAHQILSNVLNFGYRDERLQSVATKRATVPRHVRPEMAVPTDGKVRELLDVLSVQGEWARCVDLLARTGMRRGEVVGLRWSDIEMVDDGAGDVTPWLTVRTSVSQATGKRISWSETKTGRNRLIALGAGDFATIERQRAEQDAYTGNSEWIFPNWLADPNGRIPRTPQTLTSQWSRLRPSLGMEHVRLHDLRHYYASTALSLGVPINELNLHADPATTLRVYGHSSHQGKRKAATMMNDHLSSGTQKAPPLAPGEA